MSVSLLFPGQGAQVVGMGVLLAERSRIAKELYIRAADVLGFDLLGLCATGPADKLNQTEFCQPALFVHSYAALKQLEQERADLWESVTSVAGLSLGEYSAVAATGGLDFEDALRLVSIRGKAMQAAADVVESGMSSILGLDEQRLGEICDETSTEESYVQIANLLCPGNIAISGHVAALSRAEAACTEAGAMKAVRLQVAGAFHTELMRPAVEPLKLALEDVEFRPARVPVFSNVDASPHQQPAEFSGLLAQQVVTPVRWEASLRAMLEHGTDEFMEIGTGRVLAGTVKRINRKIPCSNYGDS